MFDSENWIVTFYRVPYNLRVAQEKSSPPICHSD